MTGERDSNAESAPPGVPNTGECSEGADEDASGTDDGNASGASGDGTAPLAQLGEQEGWRIEGMAARVHYQGETDRYSIEYYAPSNCTLYWKVPPDEEGNTAVPVGRDTVPEPLRERVRSDLAAAGIDPEVDARKL